MCLRDFYDVYILTKTQEFNRKLFHEVLLRTVEHRGIQHIFDGINKKIATIGNSKELQSLWSKYRKNYNYAKDISYEEVLAVLHDLTIPIK